MSSPHVNERIEEYRRDWSAGPDHPKKKRKLPKPARPVQIGSLVLLATCSLLVGASRLVGHWRAKIKKATQNELCRVKTSLELSVQVRLLRQYYLSNGALPPDPVGYLRPFLKDNKTYPRGNDFWGHPYRVDQDPDYFGVRSAGPNGKMDDRDDLSAGIKIKDLRI